jgi:hypothetical protein
MPVHHQYTLAAAAAAAAAAVPVVALLREAQPAQLDEKLGSWIASTPC